MNKQKIVKKINYFFIELQIKDFDTLVNLFIYEVEISRFPTADKNRESSFRLIV